MTYTTLYNRVHLHWVYLPPISCLLASFRAPGPPLILHTTVTANLLSFHTKLTWEPPLSSNQTTRRPYSLKIPLNFVDTLQTP